MSSTFGSIWKSFQSIRGVAGDLKQHMEEAEEEAEDEAEEAREKGGFGQTHVSKQQLPKPTPQTLSPRLCPRSDSPRCIEKNGVDRAHVQNCWKKDFTTATQTVNLNLKPCRVPQKGPSCAHHKSTVQKTPVPTDPYSRNRPANPWLGSKFTNGTSRRHR